MDSWTRGGGGVRQVRRVLDTPLDRTAGNPRTTTAVTIRPRLRRWLRLTTTTAVTTATTTEPGSTSAENRPTLRCTLHSASLADSRKIPASSRWPAPRNIREVSQASIELLWPPPTLGTVRCVGKHLEGGWLTAIPPPPRKVRHHFAPRELGCSLTRWPPATSGHNILSKPVAFFNIQEEVAHKFLRHPGYNYWKNFQVAFLY